MPAMVCAMIAPKDITKATRKAIGFPKLMGSWVGSGGGGADTYSVHGCEGADCGGSSLTTAVISRVGRPQRWQNAAPSTSTVPQVHLSGESGIECARHKAGTISV